MTAAPVVLTPRRFVTVPAVSHHYELVEVTVLWYLMWCPGQTQGGCQRRQQHQKMSPRPLSVAGLVGEGLRSQQAGGGSQSPRTSWTEQMWTVLTAMAAGVLPETAVEGYRWAGCGAFL